MKKFCLLFGLLFCLFGKNALAETVDIPDEMWNHFKNTEPFAQVINASTNLVVVLPGVSDYENMDNLEVALKKYTEQNKVQNKFSYVKIPAEVFLKAGTSGPAFWFLGHCIGLCVIDVQKRTISEPEALDDFNNEDARSFLNEF